MNIAEAVAALKAGHRVTRPAWRDAGIWLILVPGSTITVTADRPLGIAAPELVGEQLTYHPHIDIHTAAGTLGPWAGGANSVDFLLAEDWEIFPAPAAADAPS